MRLLFLIDHLSVFIRLKDSSSYLVAFDSKSIEVSVDHQFLHSHETKHNLNAQKSNSLGKVRGLPGISEAG